MILFKKHKFSRSYKQMMKKNKKNLIKLAKETKPWDWNYGIELLIAHLNFMKEYYENGENVWAREDCEWNPNAIQKTRLQMINEILSEYDEWMNCFDKYHKLIEHPETYKSTQNPDGTVTVHDLGCHLEYALGDRDLTTKAYSEEYLFHRKKFFELLNEYIEALWD